MEAGIVLFGTEIKSIRANKVNLTDSFARIDKGEAWLIGAHIAPWESTGNRTNHEPKRDRKLLLHRSQIDQLLGKTKAKGLTLVPLKLYITARGKAKVELGHGGTVYIAIYSHTLSSVWRRSPTADKPVSGRMVYS